MSYGTIRRKPGISKEIIADRRLQMDLELQQMKAKRDAARAAGIRLSAALVTGDNVVAHTLGVIPTFFDVVTDGGTGATITKATKSQLSITATGDGTAILRVGAE